MGFASIILVGFESLRLELGGRGGRAVGRFVLEYGVFVLGEGFVSCCGATCAMLFEQGVFDFVFGVVFVVDFVFKFACFI